MWQKMGSGNLTGNGESNTKGEGREDKQHSMCLKMS